MSKLWLVEAQSSHRLYYLVQSETQPNGQVATMVSSGQLVEFGQQFLGEMYCGCQEISRDRLTAEYAKLNGIRSPDVSRELVESKINPLPAVELGSAEESDAS